MGLVFVFDIVNVKDGPTRYKHGFYYTLVLIEDVILLAFWYVESGGNHVSQMHFISISIYSFKMIYFKIKIYITWYISYNFYKRPIRIPTVIRIGLTTISSEQFWWYYFQLVTFLGSYACSSITNVSIRKGKCQTHIKTQNYVNTQNI